MSDDKNKDDMELDEKKSATEEILAKIVFEETPELFEINVDTFYRGFDDIPDELFPPDISCKLTPIDKYSLLERPPNIHKIRGLHVMLVGRPSSGKTTVLNRVMTAIFDKRIPHFSTKGNMNLLLDFKDFRGDERMKVSDILLADVGFQDDVLNAGIEWMKKNSHRVLFMIDHFCKMRYPVIEKLRGDEIYNNTVTTPATVFELIFSRQLFPKCNIMTATRPYKAKCLTGKSRPDRVVIVGEITGHTMRNFARGFIGPDHQNILGSWTNYALELNFLNRTTGYYLYNIMALRSHRRYQHPTSVSEVLLELMISATDVVSTAMGREVTAQLVIQGLRKLAKLAYIGISIHKFTFSMDEATRLCGYHHVENEICGVAYPTGLLSLKRILREFKAGSFRFLDIAVQEFLCSMHTLTLSVEEFERFVMKNLNEPYFYNIRRMICGLLFSDNLNALMEKFQLIPDGVDNRPRRKEIFLKKISEQLNSDDQPKGYDLLDILQTLTEFSEWIDDEVLPEKLEVMDFSGVPLFRMDMLVIGKALRKIKYVGHLNLTNCNISGYNAQGFVKAIENSPPKIIKLTVDYCTEWVLYIQSVESVAAIVRECQVEDFSMNHCNMSDQVLEAFSEDLGPDTTFKTLRIARHPRLSDCGYKDLYNFVMQHKIQNLYLSYKDLDSNRTELLHGGVQNMRRPSGNRAK